jgi:hypothetical protein
MPGEFGGGLGRDRREENGIAQQLGVIPNLGGGASRSKRGRGGWRVALRGPV